MRKNKKVVLDVLYVFLKIIFIISLLYIIIYIFQIAKTKNDLNLIQKIMIRKDTYEENNLNRTNNTNYENNNEYYKIKNFKEIQKINSDIIAWIEIKNSKINYPVLKSQNNDFYLKKNYNKEYDCNGSIFMDYRCNLDKLNSNLIIYGHNNGNGLMFDELLKYNNKEFYNTHREIELITNNNVETYEIISVFKSRVFNENEKNVFRYYNYIEFKDEKDFFTYINNVKLQSLYDINYEVNEESKLITLSTCEYSNKNGRFVIVAIKK